MITLRILVLAVAAAAPAAFAQTTIDQNKALAGNVTPGDTPGFPITISQPGSYRLTGNLTVPASADGIVITGENVTLDLNGFTIRGPGTCIKGAGSYGPNCTPASSHAGVRVNSPTGPYDSVLRNGTVQGFWFGVSMEYGRAHDLSVLENKVGLYSSDHILASRINARANETGVQVYGGVVSDSWVLFNGTGFRGAGIGVSTLLNSGASFNNLGVSAMRIHAVNANTNDVNTANTQDF